LSWLAFSTIIGTLRRRCHNKSCRFAEIAYKPLAAQAQARADPAERHWWQLGGGGAVPFRNAGIGRLPQGIGDLVISFPNFLSF
jgi:hypothetical protein